MKSRVWYGDLGRTRPAAQGVGPGSCRSRRLTGSSCAARGRHVQGAAAAAAIGAAAADAASVDQTAVVPSLLRIDRRWADRTVVPGRRSRRRQPGAGGQGACQRGRVAAWGRLSRADATVIPCLVGNGHNRVVLRFSQECTSGALH